jgi:hypothetical protein
MGRHRWTNRLTVEDCPLRLCVAAFHRAGTFACPPGTISTLTWTTPSDEWQGRLECRVEHSGPTGLAIYIRRQCARISAPVDEQLVPVTTVRPPLGGKRFWFVCVCGRRAGRLYLPPGQRIFRCRHCHWLTYQSAREHDQRLYDLSRNPGALRLALSGHRRGNWKRFLFGIKALKLLAARCDRQRRRQRELFLTAGDVAMLAATQRGKEKLVSRLQSEPARARNSSCSPFPQSP